MEVLNQWRHGIVYPHWAAYAHWGYGEPRFLFYPPLSWTLGAVLGAILPWKIVPGAYCWIVLMLAGIAMYRLTREWLSPSDALFAAIFYALNPYHLLIVYWRSAYAELLVAVLLPCMLLCLLRLKDSGTKATLSMSLVLAAAWLANVPAALMITYSTAGLALLLAARVLVRDRSSGPAFWRLLLRAGFAIVLGASLASFYLIPAIYEQRWINISEVLSPGVRPQDNFLFTMLADPDHNRFNLLVSIIAMSEIVILTLAIWLSRSPKHKKTTGGTVGRSAWILASALAVGSAFLLISASNPLWQLLPKLQFVQLPFRWLLCLNAGLAVLLPMATRRCSLRAAACAALLATILIAGYRTQPPWWELASDIRGMRDAIAGGSGYEGTDEYVPAGVDAYNVDIKLPLVSDEAGAPLAVQTGEWGPTEKHFKLHADVPEEITIRLFNYPAWEVTVNGHFVRTKTTDDVGLMQVPIAAGDNDIRIHFGQTRDRLAGIIVSLLSLLLLILLKLRPKWLNRFPVESQPSTTSQPASPAA